MAASQKQQLMFFRAPDGRVFVDNIGSQIAREGAGEVELINAMNIRRVIASRPIPPTGGPLPDDTSLASTVPGALAAPIPTRGSLIPCLSSFQATSGRIPKFSIFGIFTGKLSDFEL